MDIAWLKEAFAVIATHGPWALLAWYLAWNLIKEGKTNREVHVRNTEVLSRLSTLIEALSVRGDKK